LGTHVPHCLRMRLRTYSATARSATPASARFQNLI
jgi:hypothetical protein